MVDKCPNCGQPGRPGARFCTSCGFRLPERPVEPEPSPLSRSPFATTSTVAASWWPSSAPSGAQLETAGETAPSDPAEGGQDAAPMSADAAASSDTQAAPSEESVPAPTVASSETGPLAAEPETATESGEPAPFPAWPSFPTYGSSSSQPASTWDTAPAADAGQSSEPEDLAAAVDQLAGVPMSESPPVEPSPVEPAIAEAALVEPPPVIAEEFEAPPWIEPPAAAAAPTEAFGEAPAPVVPDDALARAQSLVDELKTLLPTLAGPAPAAAPEDHSGLVQELTQARADATAPQSRFDALMAVVETAKERPRDIDVMLDLSRHVEAIAALKDSYDRCLGAIDAAVSHLKAE